MTQAHIQFTKMHGLGNDFVIINTLKHPVDVSKLDIPALSNRHTGIGFDQLLIITASTQADYACRIFNPDGSEAEQCGNGLRCVARYLYDEGLCRHKNLSIETLAGIFPVTIQDQQHIRVALGIPQIQHSLTTLEFSSQPRNIAVSILSLGNPHTITKVDTFDKLDTAAYAKAITSHRYFPAGTNVGFMQVMNPNYIRLRTIERGAGETHACGSNACAAVAAGIVNGWLTSPVTVEYRYGTLTAEWQGSENPIYLTGPADKVFDGTL